jgi:hypothetical protein
MPTGRHIIGDKHVLSTKGKPKEKERKKKNGPGEVKIII